ncbi:MAG: helix-turn-helix domain-containing protein [Sphingobacterium sp.]|nr:helix-turn-helix domain-containing protein [Sphingobacterium sp.]
MLDDAAESLAQAGIDPSIVRHVLADVRARWVGQVYIRQRDPSAEVEIRRALESGQPLREVARRVGVSERTIRRRRSAWFD